MSAHARPKRWTRWLWFAGLAVIPLSFAVAGGTAWAYWVAGSTAGSNGVSSATSVNTGATPTTSVTGGAVTVSWSASTLASGQAVSGYQVKRYDATTLALQSIGSACTGTIASTSCVEAAVPAGTWKYSVTPVFATNWRGAESAKSSTATVANIAPVATAESYSTAEDSALSVAASGVLANDSDGNGDALTAVLVSGVAHGSLTLGSNGSIAYTPTADYNGSDSFTYKANDGSLDSSAVTVSITVTAANDAPVNSVSGAQQTPKNTNLVFSSANNNLVSISDVDAASSTVQVQLTATNGTITLPVLTGLTFTVGDGTSDATMTFTGTIATINSRLSGMTFIPTNNYTGTGGALQIVTSDLGNTGSGGTKTDTDSVAITVTSLGIFDANTEIGATAAGTSSAYSAGSYTVKGSGWDIWDVDDGLQYLYRQMTGDGRLTARVVSETVTPTTNAAAKAGVMLRESLANNSRQAMMNVKVANGTEFVYRASTGGTSAASTTAALTPPYWVRITRVGDAITAERSANGTTWTQQGTTQTIAMGSTIYVGLAVSAVDVTKLNTAVFDNVAISTPPTTVADSYSTNEDTTLNVAASGVLANDIDPENNTLTATLVSGTTGLTLNANGSFTYVPPADFSGTASFTYKANDGAFDSNTVTVNITVNPANETPSFTKGANQSAFPTSGAQTVSGWATAISPGAGESSQLVYFTTTNDNNSLFTVQPQVSSTGTLTYTPATGANGTATVSVRISDNGGTANGGVDTSAIQTFTITIAPDTTGPTGGSVDAMSLTGTGSRYAASTTLSLAFSKGSDPSGLAATGALLKRATATLSSTGGADGVCGTFGTYSLITGGTDPVSPKTDTVTDQACYRYQYTAQDSLGNSTTYTSGDIKVDLTGPSAPSLSYSSFTNTYWPGSGTTVYYRSAAASGSVTVTGTATDSLSGVASYGYPSFGTNWTSTPGSLGVNVYSWSGSPAAPGTKQITATNNAGVASSNSPVTFTADDTAPTTGTLTYVNGSTSGGSISVSFTTGTDGASGIATRLLQRASAPLTGRTCGTYGSFATITGGTNPSSPVVDSTVAATGFCYKYQYVVSDNVGNSSTTTSASVAHTPYGAYWAFNAGSGTSAVDSFSNANTGTLQAGAGWTTGRVGSNAVSVNGTSTGFVDVPNAVIDTSQSYTAAAWVKFNNVTGYQSLISIDGTSNSPFYLQLDGGPHTFRFAVTGSDSASPVFTNVNGVTPVAGTWYHLAGVYDKTANTIQLYVNGVLQGTATPGTVWTGTGHTVIGRAQYAGAITDFTNGAIDEARLYDRALSASEISALAGSYSTTILADTGLVNYWRLGDSTGTSAVDSKGTNTGTYVGSPTKSQAGIGTVDTNTAVTFNGSSQYISATRSVSTNFSIEVWFKTTQSYSNDLGNPHCSQWWQGAALVDADTGGAANDFGMSLCDGKLVAGVGNTDTSVISSSAYNNGAWHQAVMTRTQSTGLVTIYVDGVSVGSVTANTNALTASASFNIARNTSAVNYFNGTLDEISIYNTALSGATVLSHYQAVG